MTEASSGSTATRPRRAAATILVLYGGIVVLQALFGGPGAGGPSAVELGLAGVHLALSVAVAAGLWRGRRWAWWGTLLLAGLGLFFLLPVAIAVVLGGGRETARSGGELAFILGAVLVLLLLLGILVPGRRAFGDPRRRGDGG